MIRVSPLITGDDNTLSPTDGESIDVELTKGFIMYLRSWDMIVNNTQRYTHTKSTLKQIIDTGITGEKCTETYRPAPHIKRWNCKVQGSLVTVVQLASELFLNPDEHGVGTNDAQQQTNGTVSGILANDIGAGTVTECDKACTSVVLHMVKAVDVVARLEQSLHDNSGTVRTNKYTSSPSELDRARSKSVLEELDKIIEEPDEITAIPDHVIDALKNNMTSIVRECYEGVKVGKRQRKQIKGENQWELMYNWLAGGDVTYADIARLISHHYTVLQHQLMETKVNQVIKLTKKVLNIELECLDVLGNGLSVVTRIQH